jgi:hypothetical protein
MNGQADLLQAKWNKRVMCPKNGAEIKWGGLLLPNPLEVLVNLLVLLDLEMPTWPLRLPPNRNLKKLLRKRRNGVDLRRKMRLLRLLQILENGEYINHILSCSSFMDSDSKSDFL